VKQLLFYFYGEDRSTVHEHENEEAGFKVTVFNVALDTLICEITSRSETTSKVNSMFHLFGIQTLIPMMQKHKN